MYTLYLIALIPVFIGALLWIISKRIVWWEAICVSGVGFITAVIVHCILMFSMGVDEQTFSGRVISVTHYPFWIETHMEMRSYTVMSSDGKSMETEYRLESDTDIHPDMWFTTVDYGYGSERSYINDTVKSEVLRTCNETIDHRRTDGTTISGDPNVYRYDVHGIIIPVTKTGKFYNKVKISPTVFSYSPVPTNVPVYNWPDNPNPYCSNRLLGESNSKLSIRLWDEMNSRLGHSKRVNVILVGFKDNQGSDIAQYQEAKWCGGKKNDLVLCYGGNPRWTRVFGWTERADVKRNLETILLSNEINNDLIPVIEAEITKNYVIKDWTKFDYITIYPATWAYILLIVMMSLGTVIIAIVGLINGVDKE